MEAAAGELAFEKAARIRDKIARLNRLVSKQFVSSVADRDVDVLALVQAGGMIAVNIVGIRGGQHVGDRTHFPVKNASSEPMTDEELTEVLESFIAQHYIGREVPGMIVSTLEFDVEALAEALSTQANSKVSVLCNPIGEKRVWLQMAEENARLAIAARQRQSDTGNERLQALIVALDLPEGTQRLECFDISHTMGEATVASCVVFDQNAMQTGQYRRFNIQTVSDGDDYGAMKEALTRRAARIAKEEVPHPDVWVIDGGKGQVGIAAQVLAEAGLHDIVLFGSAKGVERKKGMEQIVFPDREDTVRLPADHPGLHRSKIGGPQGRGLCHLRPVHRGAKDVGEELHGPVAGGHPAIDPKHAVVATALHAVDRGFLHPGAHALLVAAADHDRIEHGRDAGARTLRIVDHGRRVRVPMHAGPRQHVLLEIVRVQLHQTGHQVVALQVLGLQTGTVAAGDLADQAIADQDGADETFVGGDDARIAQDPFTHDAASSSVRCGL